MVLVEGVQKQEMKGGKKALSRITDSRHQTAFTSEFSACKNANLPSFWKKFKNMLQINNLI